MNSIRWIVFGEGKKKANYLNYIVSFRTLNTFRIQDLPTKMRWHLAYLDILLSAPLAGMAEEENKEKNPSI